MDNDFWKYDNKRLTIRSCEMETRTDNADSIGTLVTVQKELKIGKLKDSESL